MAGRSIVNSGLLIQKETTPGVAATNNMRRVLGLNLMPGTDAQGDSFKASGSKVPTAYVPNSETGAHTLDVIQEFNALTYILTGAFGAPVSAPVAGAVGNATTHTYQLRATQADPLVTFTGIWGDSGQALLLRHLLFQSLGLTIQRGQLTLDTSAISYAPETGQALPVETNEVQTLTITGTPAGGDFTLTYGLQTTAAIAYNAAAADVQTALIALSNIDPGEVVCAGGPLPGTPVSITFGGDLGNQPQTLITANGGGLTGGSAPAAAVTVATPGVSTTTIGAIPVAARTWDVYCDDSWAELGDTKLLACYEGGVDFGDKYDPDWVINSALPSFDSVIESADLEPSVTLTLGFDAAAVSLHTDWKAGTLKFLQFKSTGPKIDVTSAPADVFAGLTINLCVRITQPGEWGAAPNSSAVSLPFTGQIELDPVSGNACTASLTNLVTGL